MVVTVLFEFSEFYPYKKCSLVKTALSSEFINFSNFRLLDVITFCLGSVCLDIF